MMFVRKRSLDALHEWTNVKVNTAIASERGIRADYIERLEKRIEMLEWIAENSVRARELGVSVKLGQVYGSSEKCVVVIHDAPGGDWHLGFTYCKTLGEADAALRAISDRDAVDEAWKLEWEREDGWEWYWDYEDEEG